MNRNAQFRSDLQSALPSSAQMGWDLCCSGRDKWRSAFGPTIGCGAHPRQHDQHEEDDPSHNRPEFQRSCFSLILMRLRRRRDPRKVSGGREEPGAAPPVVPDFIAR